ncbi:hypothetical protein XNW1_4780005 [Xenorhabdus nematophila str. Websteri]|nr:hypothetical protein XNW1_4780005 [Xenorhabdus nematophila str. Websteri]
MGKIAKRFLATEIQQPERPFRRQIEGTQGLPLEEPEHT